MRVAKFLRQSDVKWLDIRHVQTLCWMIIGIIHSEQVRVKCLGHLHALQGQSTPSRTNVGFGGGYRIAASTWFFVYQALLKQTLVGWGEHRLYLRRGHNNGMESLLYCVVRGEIPAGGQFQCRGELCLLPAAQCAYRRRLTYLNLPTRQT